ncbi:MAG: condensation domain-containing protein [Cyanobacteria bacterium J06621_3]
MTTTDLFSRVAALTPQQRSALAQKLTTQKLTTASSTPATQRLVAYVVLQPSEQDTPMPTAPADIHTALKKQLPAYMVPAVVVPLSALPRTANGKIDTRALTAPSPTISQTDKPSSAKSTPKTPAEKKLLQIWQHVLKLEAISIHDNFFELGGDSILSIQIVSQAREQGLRIAPNQLFEQPTIAELAAVVNITPKIQATQGAVIGPVPLTPIQHWFFAQNMSAPQHWHQALLLELPATVSFERVKETIKTLWQHHDALRLRFTQQQTWQQYNMDADGSPELVQINLGELSEVDRYGAEWKGAITAHATRLHTSTVLAKGNLFQAVHFTSGKAVGVAQPSWLLISLHHLATDGISWQILQSDLQTLLSSPSTKLPQLPAKTTAFKAWAETLTSQVSTRVSELPFWRAQLAATTHLPFDSSSSKAPTERTASTHSVALNTADTSALLQTVPAAYNTQINDALVTALAQVLEEWIKPDNSTDQSIIIDLESHGRNQTASDIDLSRTVGWFTAVYPVRLQLRKTANTAIKLKDVKEQLRQIPDKGIGYGILRYLSSPSTQQQLSEYPTPDLLFNYLGQRNSGESVLSSPQVGNAVRILNDIDLGELRAPNNSRSYALEINAWIANGQLQMNWTYDINRYHPDTIEKVANSYLSALQQIIAHCIAIKHGGFTPSDFPDTHFTQAQLDSFIAQLSQAYSHEVSQLSIEAIYPLALIQQTFLWHSLQSSVQAGLLHMRGTLAGELQPSLLQQAWQIVFNHHAALRASVHWENLDQPVQVVTKSPVIPWQQLDYRTQPDAEQAIAAFLQNDRTQGLNFTQSPITRLTLIQLTNQTHELIWTSHHLMLDGWSSTLVFHQVLQTYESLLQNHSPSLPPAPTYQIYIHWLTQQNLPTAKHHWQQTLKGFTTPTPIPNNINPLPLDGKVRFSHSPPTTRWLSVAVRKASAFAEAQTTQLNTYLRTHQLTLNTLIQGTWALLLSLTSGQSDVVFGATISGRQADIPNIESMVGLLTNVLPVRAIISPDMAVLDWLQTLQTQQAKSIAYAYASTPQIQAWSGLRDRLFNSLLVIENYPISPPETPSTLTLTNLQSGIISTYDLTIIVKPGKQLTLYAQAPTDKAESLEALLSDFAHLLNAIVTGTNQSIAQLYTHTHTLRSYTQQATEQPTTYKSQPADTLPDASTDLPCNPLELQLTRIWEAVLGKSALNTQANFFDLGGDSLSAVQLFNQIQQQLGRTLPLASLFQAPTIRQLAALLSQAQPATAWTSLVPINPLGDRIPLFFHGGSADALTWARFSRLLGPDQPFYALQRPDLNDSSIKEMTVEALAATCIKEIKTVQPTGPYVIGGHCFGGAVAFEIARQLQMEGEAIASLIQIDAYCPNAQPHTSLGQLQERLQLSYFLLRKSYYYHGKPQKLIQLPKKIWQKLKPTVASPTTDHNNISSIQPSHTTTTQSSQLATPQSTTTAQTTHLPYEQRYAQAHQANIRAADTYYPQNVASSSNRATYTGPLHIFCASTQILSWRYGPTLGWETVTTGPITTTIVPGIFGNLFNQASSHLLTQKLTAHLTPLQQHALGPPGG